VWEVDQSRKPGRKSGLDAAAGAAYARVMSVQNYAAAKPAFVFEMWLVKAVLELCWPEKAGESEIAAAVAVDVATAVVAVADADVGVVVREKVVNVLNYLFLLLLESIRSIHSTLLPHSHC
jgi:hypothetical protein